jgi:hypothetical protein
MKENIKSIEIEFIDSMKLFKYFINELEEGHYEQGSKEHKKVIENLEFCVKRSNQLLVKLRVTNGLSK